MLMCRSCWVEYGQPSHRSPAIDRAIELIRRIYDTEPVGGVLHVQLDDWNISGVWEPYEPMRGDLADPSAWGVSVELAALMNSLPESDRAAALAWYDGFATDPNAS